MVNDQSALEDLKNIVEVIGKLRDTAYVKSPMNGTWNRSWMVSVISAMRAASLSFTEASADISTTNTHSS